MRFLIHAKDFLFLSVVDAVSHLADQQDGPLAGADILQGMRLSPRHADMLMS